MSQFQFEKEKNIYSPSTQAGCDTSLNFSADFNCFEFRVFLLLDRLQYQEYSLPNYLPIAGERIVGFKVLTLCEMQKRFLSEWKPSHHVHFLRQ